MLVKSIPLSKKEKLNFLIEKLKEKPFEDILAFMARMYKKGKMSPDISMAFAKYLAEGNEEYNAGRVLKALSALNMDVEVSMYPCYAQQPESSGSQK